jgi:hypothetical protein
VRGLSGLESSVYGRGMTAASMIIAPQDGDTPGLAVRMINLLHEADRTEHAEIYRRYESELVPRVPREPLARSVTVGYLTWVGDY